MNNRIHRRGQWNAKLEKQIKITLGRFLNVNVFGLYEIDLNEPFTVFKDERGKF